jgi:hypothetical protein
MTKPRLDEMEVVEIDAIDLGDWERNMTTSEVPAAGLARLVRETKASSMVAPPKDQPQAAPRPTPLPVAPAPARPSLSPSTIEPTHDPTPERAPRRALWRGPSPRLLLGGAAVALASVVIAIAIHASRSSSSPTVEPVAAAAPAAEPTVAAPVAASPTEPAPAPRAPAAPTAAPKAASTPVTSSKPSSPPKPSPVVATKSTPAKTPPAHHHHTTATHHHAAPKTVAARSAPHNETAVEPATVDRAREAYNAGNEALFAGNSDDAIRSYREAIDVSPTLAFGHRGLGLAYAQKGDRTAAIAAFREYLKLAPHAKDAALIRKRIAGLQTAQR